jgi:hypothetical protein
MKHQFTNRIPLFEPCGIGGFDEPRMQMRAPLFFVGIQRDATPPVMFGRNRLQRLRVILVEPEEAVEFAQAESDSAPKVLPQLPAPPHHLALQPRLVHGEILRGENEELYERVGNRIRRLRRLASGPHGEIVDVAQTAPLTSPQREHLPAKPDPQGYAADELAQSTEARSGTSFRKLLPEPGQWRVVPFGAFKQILGGQLAHPERLRDVHRLPCHVQVFEATTTQHVEKLATAILGDAASPAQLQPLTNAAVVQLQLAPALLPPVHRLRGPAHRAPGMVFGGERVFHLQLASDPTADELDTQPEPTNQLLPAPAEPLKTSIPDRFLRPWEFQLSREEALYDLSCQSTFMGALGETLRRVVNWLPFRRDFRKWQMLLSGKGIDDQLWGVRPPRGGLNHRFVLAWAGGAIELGGYDPRTMLTEWRIYWRRKGV